MVSTLSSVTNLFVNPFRVKEVAVEDYPFAPPGPRGRAADSVPELFQPHVGLHPGQPQEPSGGFRWVMVSRPSPSPTLPLTPPRSSLEVPLTHSSFFQSPSEGSVMGGVAALKERREGLPGLNNQPIRVLAAGTGAGRLFSCPEA